MIDVMKVTHPTMGTVYFREEEMEDLRVNPFQRIEKQVAQGGHVSLVRVGTCRYIFTLLFNMYFRDTLEKLDRMRDAQAGGDGNDEFQFYPFWLYDQVTSFPVLWTNVAEFHERHKHGRIHAQWSQEIILEEVVESTCVVIS